MLKRLQKSRPFAVVAQAVVVCLLLLASANSVVFADVNESPINAANNHRQASITAGGSHACALMETGGVKCWGAHQNAKGQLGGGASIVSSTTPVQVQGLTSGVKAVTAGGAHTCALLETGGVKCWGANSGGQLGDGTTTDQSSPVQVQGLTSGVKAVTAGGTHTCALMETGSVKCWGYNGAAFRVLGDVGTVERWLEPTQVIGLENGVAAISASAYHTCALIETGGVKCWGRNVEGQLGNGFAQQSNTVVQVSGLTSGVAAIDLGYSHSCALMIDGSVKCWGYNSFGQTGNGNTANQLSPVSVTGLTGVVLSLSLQAQSTCALIVGGSVECWGINGWTGGLGDGTTTNRLSPTQVSGLTSGISAISSGYYYGCALSSAGSLKCWGDNQNWQLGLPFAERWTQSKLVPTQVTELSTGVGLTTTTTTTSTPTTTTTTSTTVSSGVGLTTTTSTAQRNDDAITISPSATAPVGQRAVARISTTTSAPSAFVAPMPSTTALTSATTTSVPNELPIIAAVGPGEAVVRVGEVNQTALTERIDNQLVVNSGTMRTALSIVNENGDVQKLDADGNMRILKGDKLRVLLSGFKPEDSVELWLFSTPSLLGRTEVNASGELTSDFSLPRNLESGQHRIAIVSGSGKPNAVNITIGVMAGTLSNGSGFSLWFIVTPLALAVSGALILPAVRRRRKTHL